jgi:hypothetical protein
MDLLARARKSLNTSIGSTSAPSSQAHALDSIAASLLHIAENIQVKPVTDEHIELIVRRLLDATNPPANKKKGAK